MAGNKLRGIIMTNPMAVTTNELNMNGKNPNLPAEGCHAEEKSS